MLYCREKNVWLINLRSEASSLSPKLCGIFNSWKKFEYIDNVMGMKLNLLFYRNRVWWSFDFIFSYVFLMHEISLNLTFANVVYIFTDSVKSLVNGDLGVGNAFIKPVLYFLQAHQPRLHKNIPSVNSKLKVVKHLIRFVSYLFDLEHNVTLF